MSISSNFPNIQPSLNLSFALTKRLDPRVTFTRATTGTVYDGVTTAKAEENLLTYSQNFTTGWDLSTGVTASGDTTTAPDGTSTADTLTETATTSIHTANQSASSSGVLTLSVFAKLSAGTPFLTIGISKDSSNYAAATFDLSLGTVTQTQTGAGTYSGGVASISASAQSFYRCVLTVTTDTASIVRIGFNNTGTPTTANRGFGATYLGVVTNAIYVWGAQLEQRSAVTSYTATTTQAITNYIPVLLTAASGVPRFDHNPTTDVSLGLLIEEQRTNLLTYSSEFDNAAWTKTNASITANTIVAPDGALTGDKLVEDTANATHSVATGSISFTSGTSYTLSVYAKAAERTAFSIIRSGTGGASASFDLSTLTATNLVGTSALSITAVGNGWYRCVMSWSAGATASRTHAITLENPSGTQTYTGDGYSGIFIWGAQLEAGAFPTSYIATTSASVTRNADAASMTGTNFSSWFSNAEGTLYAEINPKALAASSGAVINDNTTSNRIRIATASTSDQTLITTSGTAQATLDAGTPVIDTSMKLASSYKVNDFALSLNGGTVATDTAGTVPVVTQLQIGAETTTIGTLTIKKLAYYPLRVTDAQLQALTS